MHDIRYESNRIGCLCVGPSGNLIPIIATLKCIISIIILSCFVSILIFIFEAGVILVCRLVLLSLFSRDDSAQKDENMS